jgi:hypothetical protein
MSGTPNRGTGGAGASPGGAGPSPQQLAQMMAAMGGSPGPNGMPQMSPQQMAQLAAMMGGRGGPGGPIPPQMLAAMMAAAGGGGPQPGGGPGAGPAGPSPQQLAAQQQHQQSLALQENKELMHKTIMTRFAVLLSDIATVTKILEEGDRYDVNHSNPAPLTFPPLLVVACMVGNSKMVAYLLEKKPSLGIALNFPRRKVTVLHIAIMFGFTGVVKQLIDAGMKPIVLGSPDRLQGAELPLFTACATGNADLVRYFVDDLGAETAITLAYAPPPGQPAPPFLQSLPRDAIYAACIGYRPYMGDMMDMMEVVLSRGIEGVQGLSIPPQAYPAWPKSTEPALMTTEALDNPITASKPNYKAVLSLLIDKYGLGGINGPSTIPVPAEVANKPGYVNLRDPFPAAKWHDYARVAAQHANKEAVEFFLERGLLNTPLPAHIHVSKATDEASTRAVPALAVTADAGKDVKMEVVGGSVLGVGLLGSLSYPVTTLEALHTFTVRVACRPQNCFRLAHLLPATAIIVRQILNLPSDVQQIAAMVARHAGAMEKQKKEKAGAAVDDEEEEPTLSPRYIDALKAQCLHITMFLTNVMKQRPTSAPHYEDVNKSKTMDTFIISACEHASNRFAMALSALQEFAKKDSHAQSILEHASSEYKKIMATSFADVDDDDDESEKAAEKAFMRLLDPSEAMNQERFTAICMCLASNQRKKGGARWRKAAWGPEPLFCKEGVTSATTVASSSTATTTSTTTAAAFSDTDYTSIDPETYPLSSAFRTPSLDESSAAGGAGAAGGKDSKKTGGGGGFLKSALTLIKETATVDDGGAGSDEFAKLVSRQVVIREIRQHTAELLYYYKHPQNLSLSSSLYQAAEDVCSPDFWGAPPPPSAVKGEKNELDIQDVPMPEGAAASHLVKTIEKAFSAGYRSGPFFIPASATTTSGGSGSSEAVAAAAAVRAKEIGASTNAPIEAGLELSSQADYQQERAQRAAAIAGSGSTTSSSAASATTTAATVKDVDEDDLLLRAMAGAAGGAAAASSSSSAKAPAKGKKTTEGGKAGDAAAIGGRSGVCGNDAWFPASLAAAVVAAGWIVVSGWLNAQQPSS